MAPRLRPTTTPTAAASGIGASVTTVDIESNMLQGTRHAAGSRSRHERADSGDGGRLGGVGARTRARHGEGVGRGRVVGARAHVARHLCRATARTGVG